MPQSYLGRLIDRVGRTGTLIKVIEEIYDDKLGVLINTVTSDSTFYYIPVPIEQKLVHEREGYAADKDDWQIWVDPELDISIRDGDNPDEVVLDDSEMYRVIGIDTEFVYNHSYKTVTLKKREATAQMV